MVVRVEGSDASLIQPKSRIQAVDQKPTVDPEDIASRLSSLKWMMTRGWLTQAEYDFLKATLQFGVYERTLAVRKSTGIAKEDPATVASDLLSVWHFNDTGMEKQHVTSAQAFELLRAHRAQGSKSAMVGLWTEQKANVLVVEDPHIGAIPTEPGQPDDVTGADQLQHSSRTVADARRSLSVRLFRDVSEEGRDRPWCAKRCVERMGR
ncbi:MAG: hypothetical protein M9937_20530 [Chelatococcus sp.]|uniref:hypothetical protein n=1 Tax=Chelatococcus sp. TaxID=1953771 RepID=UPI002625AA88|nr:hypothetical protein [Chelatococcus sp.]MCO5078057.1 hypothetical protein [Chelatococcus sp.]